MSGWLVFKKKIFKYISLYIPKWKFDPHRAPRFFRWSWFEQTLIWITWRCFYTSYKWPIGFWKTVFKKRFNNWRDKGVKGVLYNPTCSDKKEIVKMLIKFVFLACIHYLYYKFQYKSIVCFILETEDICTNAHIQM